MEFHDIIHSSTSVLGLGLVWYAGETILHQLGHKRLADLWSIIISVGGMAVVARYTIRLLRQAAAMFDLT